MKLCSKCGISKVETEFHKNRAQCKECRRSYMESYYSTNQRQILAQKREWYDRLDQKERWNKVKASVERSPESFLADQLYHIRSRSNRPEYSQNPSDPLKREVDLDRAYLLDLWNQQSGKCALTGLPMVHQFGSPRSASIDRIDSSKGHIKGNVQIICLAINRMKHTLTNEQVLSFLREVSDSLRGAV